jgi:D-alanyl-D-alanine endopeptidase (penicillin-binding protein 7)
MLKVLEGILGMYLNRLSILILTVVFGCGPLMSAPAIAASQDKEKQTKTSKAAVKPAKSAKKQKY